MMPAIMSQWAVDKRKHERKKQKQKQKKLTSSQRKYRRGRNDWFDHVGSTNIIHQPVLDIGRAIHNDRSRITVVGIHSTLINTNIIDNQRGTVPIKLL